MVAAIAGRFIVYRCRPSAPCSFEVAKLAGGIIYTGCLQALGVVLSYLARILMTGEGSDAPHIKTMRLIATCP